MSNEDIKFCTDIVERSCRFGLSDRDKEFYALSNFQINILSEVQAGEYSGFTCRVTLYTGEVLGDAFYTEEQASSGRKKWLQALMSSISNYTLKCTATSVQINGYLMKKYQHFYEASNPAPDRKIAVRATGLQPTGAAAHKIWVLNEDVQYDVDGDLLDIESSPFIWLGRFSGNKVASVVQIPAEQASCARPKTRKKAGRALIRALQGCYVHNFPASLLVLGAEILCLHYELLIEMANQVPVTIVFGDVGLGKSRATRAALSLLGVQHCNYFHELTDSRALRVTCNTTLGVVIDDPTDAHWISEKIIQHFEKGSHGSAHGTYTPRTSFITSMNYKCLKQLSREQRLITRTVLIPFIAGDDSEGGSLLGASDRAKMDDELQKAIKNANMAAGIMISLGQTLQNTQDHTRLLMDKVAAAIGVQTLQRVYVSYGWLLHATYMLLEALGMPEHKEAVWLFFEAHVVPAIRKYQLDEHDGGIEKGLTAAKFEEDLLQLVTTEPPSEVLTFLKPVKDSFAILMPQLIKRLKNKGVLQIADLQKAMHCVFGESLETGKQHAFLRPGSRLSTIPSGRLARKHLEVIYGRCVLLAKSSLSKETCKLLEQACNDSHGLDCSTSVTATSSSSLQLSTEDDPDPESFPISRSLNLSSTLCNEQEEQPRQQTSLEQPLQDSTHNENDLESSPISQSLNLSSTLCNEQEEQPHQETSLEQPLQGDTTHNQNGLESSPFSRSLSPSSTQCNEHEEQPHQEASEQPLQEESTMMQSSSPLSTKDIRQQPLATSSPMLQEQQLVPQTSSRLLFIQGQEIREKAANSQQHQPASHTQLKEITKRKRLQQRVSMATSPGHHHVHRTPWPLRSPKARHVTSPLKAALTVVSVDKPPDNGNSNICRGCGGKFLDRDSNLWVGCDRCESHWWHFKCAGFKRKPSTRTKFICSLCKTTTARRQLKL